MLKFPGDILKRGKFMKKSIRFLAFALSLILALGCFSIAVFAGDVKNYLVLGDSIGYGSGLRNPGEASYGRIVADTNGYNYKNDAVPGHTTKNMLKKIAQLDVVSDIEWADIISISIGGNNFLQGNIPKLVFDLGVLNKTSSVEKVLEGFKADFNRIISTIKSYNDDVLVVVQTLYNPMPGAVHSTFQKGVEMLNATYIECLEENPGSFVVADVASAFPVNPELVAFDFIHPSAEGNKVIARVILKTLKDAGLESADEIVVNFEGKDTGTKVIRAFFLAACKFANLLHGVK